jgi:hypothetical protein
MKELAETLYKTLPFTAIDRIATIGTREFSGLQAHLRLLIQAAIDRATGGIAGE